MVTHQSALIRPRLQRSNRVFVTINQQINLEAEHRLYFMDSRFGAKTLLAESLADMGKYVFIAHYGTQY